MKKGKVVIQLLVYSEPIEMIDRLFDSLLKLDYPRQLVDIVVLNNYCADHDDIKERIVGTWLPRAKAAKLRLDFYQKNPNLGFAGGHEWLYHRALKCDPEYVYLLNADATVDPAFIKEAVAYADAHSNAALVQSRIMLDAEPELLNSYGNAMHFLGYGFTLGHRSKPADDGYPSGERKPMFYPSGAGVLARVSAVRAVGGLFDPRYFLYHEDSDLGWRAILSGYDVDYAPKSVIYHRYEFSRSIKKFFWMERNRLVNLLVFYRLRTLALIAPAAFVMDLGEFGFSIRSGWWKEKLRAHAFFLKPSTWRWIFEKRKLIQSSRSRGDAFALQNMVGAITNQEVDNLLLTRVVNPFMETYLRALKAIVRW